MQENKCLQLIENYKNLISVKSEVVFHDVDKDNIKKLLVKTNELKKIIDIINKEISFVDISELKKITHKEVKNNLEKVISEEVLLSDYDSILNVLLRFKNSRNYIMFRDFDFCEFYNGNYDKFLLLLQAIIESRIQSVIFDNCNLGDFLDTDRRIDEFLFLLSKSKIINLEVINDYLLYSEKNNGKNFRKLYDFIKLKKIKSLSLPFFEDKFSLTDDFYIFTKTIEEYDVMILNISESGIIYDLYNHGSIAKLKQFFDSINKSKIEILDISKNTFECFLDRSFFDVFLDFIKTSKLKEFIMKDDCTIIDVLFGGLRLDLFLEALSVSNIEKIYITFNSQSDKERIEKILKNLGNIKCQIIINVDEKVNNQ